MSSTRIEESRLGAADAAQVRLRTLFFLSSIDYSGVFEGLLRRLVGAGHQVLVALEHQRGGLPQGKTGAFDDLRRQYEGFDYRQLPPRTDLWRIPASAIRRSLDYLRYLERPEYADAAPLRENARQRAPRLMRGLLFAPPFRSRGGRRLIAWTLRRLEAGMPIPRAVKAFISEQAPSMVLVSPLVEFGSTQGDYIRAAQAAGIPSVLLVASGDDLTSKGAIRDVPTLTVAWDETQTDQAVLLQGLPRERIVAVGAERSNGHHAPATPAAVEAIERAAHAEVVTPREGRLLRPVLWLLTPLLAIVLPLFRPRATLRAVIRAPRRLGGRARKRARTLKRRIARRRAGRRKAQAMAARQQKLARAESKAQSVAAKEEKKARAAAKEEAARRKEHGAKEPETDG